MNKTNNVAILILTGIAALTIAVGIGRFFLYAYFTLYDL